MTFYTTTVESPCGPLLCLVDENGAVNRIEFENGREKQRLAREMESRGIRLVEDEERTAEVRRQLEEYFAGRRQTFDLPLAPEGTPFEKTVWEELRRIPFGETRSYAEVARAIGRPGAARAVGRANGANPIPVVVPCHRVIGADGSLTGFGGGLDAKARLLELEGLALPLSS
jgi:methylated-DNA-[protein]-cysteine S-methyltransferase